MPIGKWLRSGLLLPRTRRKTRTIRRRKGLSKRGLAVLAIAILLVTLPVVSFVLYGLVYGAVVHFTFGGAGDVRSSYQLTATSTLHPGTIDITHILVRNTGNTDITIIVALHALNAVVSTNYYGPYNDMANIQIDLPPASGYRVVTFYLTLPAQVAVFTLSVNLSRVLDFSGFTSLATSTFAFIQPTAPTVLVYMNTASSPSNYQLTQQS